MRGTGQEKKLILKWREVKEKKEGNRPRENLNQVRRGNENHLKKRGERGWHWPLKITKKKEKRPRVIRLRVKRGILEGEGKSLFKLIKGKEEKNTWCTFKGKGQMRIGLD